MTSQVDIIMTSGGWARKHLRVVSVYCKDGGSSDFPASNEVHDKEEHKIVTK